MRFISAGAGSGKTYRLTELLNDFLDQPGIRPGGVMATTFTNKAAAELRERVRGTLVKKGRHALATAIGQARIGTVNSVCGALLTRFAFEAGLPPDQRVLDEAHAAQILKEARDVVVTGPTLSSLMRVARRLGLDEARYGTDEIPWEKALQETVHLARVNAINTGDLRACGADNANRLIALFPRPSQQDLDAVLRSAIATALPVMRQRHAANTKPIKKTAECIELLEGAERDLAAGEIVWSRWCKIANCEAEKGLVQIVQPVGDAAARHSRHPRLHADLRAYLEQLFDIAARTLDEYAERKRLLCAVDFADQERLLLDILDEPIVVETLGEEIDLLMVDEFQDTSPIQLAVFLKLAHLAKHVVWVGDVKQAIYGFRGGDAELMRAVLGALKSFGCDLEQLPHSYRSRPSLVALVNDLFSPAFPGMLPNEVTLRPKREEYTQAPAVEDWLLEGNVESQYHAIASGIALLINESCPVVDRGSGGQRALRLGDIAILARSREKVAAIAAVLQERQIAAATEQAGLLSRPEIVLALACLRRLNDDRDTIATAEIVSLAHCENPDEWVSDRLAWVNAGADLSRWRDTGEADAAPIFMAIQELRTQRPVLSPREAVELVVARCGLSRHVLQWQTSAERGRTRLVNLDQLLAYAGDYENDCRASREAATLSGFLLWMKELADAERDHLPGGGADAVQVMTHHAAKGLEWPVVILVDLASDVRNSLWDSVHAESRQAFDARTPLKERTLRHWPWPYGLLSRVPLAGEVLQSTAGAAIQSAAIDEHKRVLYVSLTRARDLIVLARAKKDPSGEWMETIGLHPRLPADGATRMSLSDGTNIPFRRRALDAGTADLPVAANAGNLRWFAACAARTNKLPLMVTPSATGESAATVMDTARIGTRIDTVGGVDRAVLGMALHTCLAADLVAGKSGLSSSELGAILRRFGVAEVVESADIHAQIQAIRAWLNGRWPEAVPWVEVPVLQVLPNGQRVAGQIDLLLRVPKGWILLDHKSTPQGQDQWPDLAAKYGGQLAAYRETVEAVTQVPVLESWLVLPVAGAAVRVTQGEGKGANVMWATDR